MLKKPLKFEFILILSSLILAKFSTAVITNISATPTFTGISLGELTIPQLIIFIFGFIHIVILTTVGVLPLNIGSLIQSVAYIQRSWTDPVQNYQYNQIQPQKIDYFQNYYEFIPNSYIGFEDNDMSSGDENYINERPFDMYFKGTPRRVSLLIIY